MARVSVLHPDGDMSDYSSYSTARTNADAGELIIIWTDLTEQILLKNEVDIWIMDGVTIDYNAEHPTLVDNYGEYDVAVKCKIYGNGRIINSGESIEDTCLSILIVNTASEVSIECDYIGGSQLSYPQSDIKIYGAKFYLKCNKVYSKYGVGMVIYNSCIDFNLRIRLLETGTSVGTASGSTALVSGGVGLISIDEIRCNSRGHCLGLRDGSVTAIVRKMSTTRRINTQGAVAPLQISQGTVDSTLVLYFDEINALNDGYASPAAIDLNQGYSTIIGRKAYSQNSYSLIVGGQDEYKNGYVNVIELKSDTWYACNLAEFENPLTIVSKSIVSNFSLGSGNSTVISIDSINGYSPIVSIKDAYIINLNQDPMLAGIYGIYLEDITPICTLNNVKIISRDEVIYLVPEDEINIKNYGMFGNNPVSGGSDDHDVTLVIGTIANDLFIDDPDLA